MPNLRRCRAHLTVHVTLEPPTGERVVHLREGDDVDLDEVVRPARPGREPLTLAEAIGDYARFFDPIDVDTKLDDAGAEPAQE